MGILDKITAVFSDKAAARSAQARAMREHYDAAGAASRQIMGSYRGGVSSRISTPWSTDQRVHGYPVFSESYAEMVARARALEMNNPLASSVLDRSTELVIGRGIRFKAASTDEAFNAEADAYIKFLTTGKRLDVRGMFTFPELQRKFYRGKKRDGDGGMLLIDESGEPKLQIIEQDQIRNASGGYKQNIRDGIELNFAGKPIRFWLEEYDLTTGISTPRGIEAKDFIFYHQSTRYCSVRGEPSFHATYDIFDQMWGSLEALAVAWRIGASHAILLLRKSPRADYDGQAQDVTNADGNPARSYPIEPGMVNVLDAEAGEDVKGFTPTQPTQAMGDIMDCFGGIIGLKFGLTIDQVLLKFKGMNYSVSRAAKLQAWTTADIEQDDFIGTFGDRFYPWAVSKGLKNGSIKRKPPADYFAYEWIPPARALVDPERDLNAGIKGVALGVDARSHIAAGVGYDFKELVRRNKADVELLKEAGLPTGLSINPQAPQDTGAASDGQG